MSWPSWLTCSEWFTHISGHPSAAGRAQDRESSPVRDRRSTTVLRHQPPPTASGMDTDVREPLLPEISGTGSFHWRQLIDQE